MSISSVPVQVSQPVKSAFPFLDLKAQYAPIRDEIVAAVTRVLDSQRFILGPEVEAFEQKCSQYLGAPFALGCASGSDALLLALMAFDIGPGDEVITTPFTFVATAGSIARLGARPVFVDIEPTTYNIDVSAIASRITLKTKAIIPVHLFGLPANMNAILEIARQKKIAVIEDAAQAIGSTYNGQSVGTLGDIGCFSFFPSKNLGGAGDGGLVSTSNQNLAAKLKVLRVHGSPKRYSYTLLGMNSRLDALQAAILQVKLAYLEEWAHGRRRNAERYRSLFEEYGLSKTVILPSVSHGCVHVYNQYTIRCRQRDELRRHLAALGIPTEVYYPSPLHLEPAFAYLNYKHGDFPVAETASQEVLALPIFSEVTEEQQRSVVSAIAEFFD
jgi:dTDP-4-amino-4,6-dideoxygalactose transaminase